MRMKRSFAVCLPVLLLVAGHGLDERVSAQSPPEAFLGTWAGHIQYGAERKVFGARFELNSEKALVMRYSIPELKFNNLGPYKFTSQGDEYRAQVRLDYFSFRLAPDRQSMTGVLFFDGSELSIELTRGELPPPITLPPLAGSVARPVWTFKTGGLIWCSPAIADRTVYFGGSDGNVYALAAKSGELLWQFKTGGPVMGRFTGFPGWSPPPV